MESFANPARAAESLSLQKVGAYASASWLVAYTLDWAGETHLLGDCSALRAYVEQMYARPRAPQRIGEIFRAMQSDNS